MSLKECLLELVCHTRWVAHRVLVAPSSARYPALQQAAHITLTDLSFPMNQASELCDIPPSALELLCDGSVYLLAAESILRTHPPTMHHFLAACAGNGTRSPAVAQLLALRWFATVGMLATDEIATVVFGPDADAQPQFRSDAELQSALAEKLADADLFFLGAHITVLRGILHRYCMEVLAPERVLVHARGIAGGGSARAFVAAARAAAASSSSASRRAVTVSSGLGHVVDASSSFSSDEDALLLADSDSQPLDEILCRWLQAVMTASGFVAAAESAHNDAGGVSPHRAVAGGPSGSRGNSPLSPTTPSASTPSRTAATAAARRGAVVSDLYRDTNDGVVLLQALRYYRPDLVAGGGAGAGGAAAASDVAGGGAGGTSPNANNANANNAPATNISIWQRQENWLGIIRALERLNLWVGVFAEELVAHGTANLQLHVLRVVEEVFCVLARHAEVAGGGGGAAAVAVAVVAASVGRDDANLHHQFEGHLYHPAPQQVVSARSVATTTVAAASTASPTSCAHHAAPVAVAVAAAAAPPPTTRSLLEAMMSESVTSINPNQSVVAELPGSSTFVTASTTDLFGRAGAAASPSGGGGGASSTVPVMAQRGRAAAENNNNDDDGYGHGFVDARGACAVGRRGLVDVSNDDPFQQCRQQHQQQQQPQPQQQYRHHPAPSSSTSPDDAPHGCYYDSHSTNNVGGASAHRAATDAAADAAHARVRASQLLAPPSNIAGNDARPARALSGDVEPAATTSATSNAINTRVVVSGMVSPTLGQQQQQQQQPLLSPTSASCVRQESASATPHAPDMAFPSAPVAAVLPNAGAAAAAAPDRSTSPVVEPPRKARGVANQPANPLARSISLPAGAMKAHPSLFRGAQMFGGTNIDSGARASECVAVTMSLMSLPTSRACAPINSNVSPAATNGNAHANAAAALTSAAPSSALSMSSRPRPLPRHLESLLAQLVAESAASADVAAAAAATRAGAGAGAAAAGRLTADEHRRRVESLVDELRAPQRRVRIRDEAHDTV